MSKKDKVDRLINSVKESYENRPPDSSYHITATDEFQEDVGKILNENPDRNVKSRIERAIEKLWFKKFWSPQKGSTDRKTARVGKMHNANIYKMRINKGGRLFFHYVTDKGEGLVPVIYLLGMVINHDKQEQKLREIIGRDELPELVEITEEPEPDDRSLGELKGDNPRTVPYSEFGEVSGLNIDDALVWLESSANIRPTRKQLRTVLQEPPILIEGQAGTGKTSIITLVLARNIHNDMKGHRMLCTCYSDNVLEVTREGVEMALTYVEKVRHGIPGSVQFTLFQNLLYELIPESVKSNYEPPSIRRPRRKVTFPAFSRRFYPTLTKQAELRERMPAELSWHLIRSVLKGQRIQDARFVITDAPRRGQDTDSRLRVKDFQNLDGHQIAIVFDIYEKYEKWKKEGELYDDLDLAYDAWKALIENDPPELYDLVFLDEAQDLTLLEYTILTSLQKESKAQAKVIAAGDPLQTINPTGFDWGRVRSFFYDSVSKKAAEILTLDTNFRTPRPIVDVSNRIQKIRSLYHSGKPKIQGTFKMRGSKPVCLEIKTDADREALRGVIAECPVDTAIIVWSRDEEEIRQLLELDADYKEVWKRFKNKGSIFENLILFNITKIKGLEFDKVILYKFASHPDFIKWQEYVLEEKELRKDAPEKTAVLYFLNRFFISVTRAVKELYIIDEEDAFEKFWKTDHWKKLLDFSKMNSTPKILGLKFFEGDLLEGAKRYKKWYKSEGDIDYLDMALQFCDRASPSTELLRVKAEIKALRYEHLADEAETEADRNGQLLRAAMQYQILGKITRAAELYFDAKDWEHVSSLLGGQKDQGFKLEEKYFLMWVISNIRLTHDNDEQVHLLKKQIVHLDENQVNLRNDLRGVKRLQNLYGGLMDELVSEVADRKLWFELEDLLGNILWDDSPDELECPRILCQYLVDDKEYNLCKRFIEEKNLKDELSNHYVLCLEKDIENFQLIINHDSKPISEIKRLQAISVIHKEIGNFVVNDKDKSASHKRCRGLISLGIAVYNELAWKEQHGLILASEPERYRESMEQLHKGLYFRYWRAGLDKLGGFEPVPGEGIEDDEERPLLNLKALYIAKAWTSVSHGNLLQAIGHFSESTGIMGEFELDSISRKYFADLNDSIASLYRSRDINEIIWTLQYQIDDRELASSKTSVSAIIQSGRSKVRKRLIEKRLFSLAMRRTGGSGTTRARSWLIEVLPVRASKDRDTAAMYVEVLFSNKSWKKAKSFSRSSPKMLPETKRFEIDARHLEYHVIKGNIRKASRTKLLKLASLYEKAELLQDAQRVMSVIPEDPVYDISTIVSDTRIDWAAKLDKINAVFEKVDRKTIVVAWSAVKQAIRNNQIDALAGMTNANRGKIGWRRLLEAHDNSLRKLLGKLTPGGAILLEYVCPRRDIRLDWISGAHRHSAPKILVPIVLRHCRQLVRDVRSYQERYESCDDLGTIAGELMHSNIRDNRKLNTIKKVPQRKVDDVLLQLIQMSQGLSLQGRTGKELGSILEQAEQKKSGKKQEQILRILEHRFGKPGGGRVLDALEMALPDIIRG